MRSPSVIPADVRRLQGEVSDPRVSAWVAANAGSGKTHVLAQRVINLLLAGVQPEKILCLTFTKAAAANMAKRVFDTLARWTTLDAAALDAAIAEQSGKAPDVRRRALARRLFARALETPGGLKVQTIHAFCTRLLHQFPFEANVAARFAVLDETARAQLLEQLTLDVLLEGASNPDGTLARSLGIAMTTAADQTFRDVVREAIGRRDAIGRWVMREGGVGEAIAALARALGVDPDEDRDSIEEEFFVGSLIAPSDWPTLAAALAHGAKADCEQARRFSGLAALSGSARLETYLEIFCTEEGSPRKSIVTRAIKDADLLERLCAEQERVCALLERRNAIICRDRSAALLTVVHAVLRRYGAEKQRRGLLDYGDLIDKTLLLLDNVDAAWVHYKLDLGIDHVLIDEAQDTSAKQWEIIRRLAAEFTAGEGARDLRRTIFVVGDEKQSIFSFQDAAPKEFALMRRYFERAHKDGGVDFVFREFKHSFRSGDSVLGAVDEVFKATAIALSVTADSGGFPPHIALPDAPPSVVEIWEPLQPEARGEIEAWDAPFDAVNETSPRVKLAQRIARTVRRIVNDRTPVGIDGRAARYGDVLVLVRQRGPLFEAIIRALKNENVEVAGADRLLLTEHIAVMDLMALADALLLAEDDLALATVLRSPLFGFSEEDLFAIAWNRGRSSLRAALAGKAAEQEKFAAAAARLDELAQAARHATLFAFYAHVLGAGGGRRQFLARLGAEANDALDEFLSLALDYERRQTPSLQGFLAWLRAARAEVKRDMEMARDEVRVMTVHGAKGLEAPIVILADTMTPPWGPRPPRLLELAGGAMIWAGRKDDDVPVVATARAAALAEAEHEYRRLLYVAMTRAADRLIVCGAEGLRARPKGCWYDLVREPLQPFLAAEDDGEEEVFRYRKAAMEARTPAAAAAGPSERGHGQIPLWLRQPAPIEAPREQTLSPSSAFEEEIGRVFAPAMASAAARRKALLRGRVIHRLMQALPDIPSVGRKDAAERYLKGAAADFSPAEQAEIARQVLIILDDPGFAEVFAVGSRAEVPIVGRIACCGGAPVAVSGQVDRLAVTADAVLIADYKTDRSAPRGLAEVPPPYVAQLALYRAVLARLYPEKTIRAALVFTDGPAVMELPGPALEAALAETLGRVSLRGRSLDGQGCHS
ncbi:MAG TPA: double-strand break repair helicase AddA [Xanthobacteraceae bacterium]|nr:double-strand break repair helicase AddA [Xanthobacteraceae bacterium]